MSKRKDISDETAHVIDEEIRQIIDRNYQLAKQILLANMDKLHLMAEALLKYETIDTEQIKDAMEGRAPREPRDWNDNGGGSAPKKKQSEDPTMVTRTDTSVGDTA